MAWGHEKIGSIYENKVWTLVDLPDDRQSIENKWIFKKKTNADDNITVYNSRLVAKGFRQVQVVDYDETFWPVVMLKSVRIMLAIAAFYDYEIWQMDVKTAFLNGYLMLQPYVQVIPCASSICSIMYAMLCTRPDVCLAISLAGRYQSNPGVDH